MDKVTLGYFWQRPRTHREPIAGRQVSSLELFHDLIYVVLIARVAHGLHGHITGESIATFAILFTLLWIGWYNGSILHDAHGRPDVRNRLLTFLQMLALASMAVFAPEASGARGRGFAASYLVVLLVLVGQWIVVARIERGDPRYGPIARRYTLTMIVMTGWIAASLVVPAEARVRMWAAYGLAWIALMGLLAILAPRAGTGADLAGPWRPSRCWSVSGCSSSSSSAWSSPGSSAVSAPSTSSRWGSSPPVSPGWVWQSPSGGPSST